MQHDPRAFLWDVRDSALAIQYEDSLPLLLKCVSELLDDPGAA